MKCSCCGKSKRFYESFALLDSSLEVCIKCDTVLCRIKDAKKYDNPVQYSENVAIIRADINRVRNDEFSKWFEAYLKRIG